MSAALSVVLVAAGSSRRMGFDKILTPVAGEPLIRHSVRAFEQCESVAEIVVVCGRGNEEGVRAALADARKVSRFVVGGELRQESVKLGLDSVTDEYVAVHDAARPLITSDFIERCFQEARKHGAATAAERVTDTLQRATDEDFCEEIVDRSRLWRMQTPQVFRTSELRRACSAAAEAGVEVTDETSTIRRLGGAVFLVENSDWNFKVTLPRDVPVAEFILRQRAAASLT